MCVRKKHSCQCITVKEEWKKILPSLQMTLVPVVGFNFYVLYIFIPNYNFWFRNAIILLGEAIVYCVFCIYVYLYVCRLHCVICLLGSLDCFDVSERQMCFWQYLYKNMDFLRYSDSSKSNTAHCPFLLPWVVLLIPKLFQIQSKYGIKACCQPKWWLFFRQCGALVWSELLRSGTFPLLFRESSLLLVTFVSLK